jgi:outer membrane protein assembly factor BamB
MKATNAFIILFCIVLFNACKKSSVDGAGSSSSSKTISSFIFKAADNPGLTSDIAGTITTDSIFLNVPAGTVITSLKPAVIHTGKSISPVSGAAQNFTYPVNYTVTAVDNTEKTYVVQVRKIINSTVYVASTDGKLYALDGDNGTLKWSYTTGGTIGFAGPTYNSGTVFIGSADRYLYALDANTGTVKWKYLTHGDAGYSTPTFYNGNLYLATTDASSSFCYLCSINAQSGLLNWENLRTYFPSNVTLSNNIGYTSNFVGLSSFDAVTGGGLISFIQGNISKDNPLVVNNILYSGTETQLMTALNATTGALIWNTSNAGTIQCGPTLEKGAIYDGAYQQMFALDSATGLIRWRYPLTTGIVDVFSAPTVSNGILYAGNKNSSLYAIDAIAGTLRWKFGNFTSGQYAGNCTVADNVVYFGSVDKNIYCLDAFTGLVRWQFPTGGAVYGGPCVVTDKMVVYHPGISGEHQ